MDEASREESDGAMTIKASEFKARCLKLMDEVAETGREIVITKNGRPVSRLVPHIERPKTIIGIDKGKVEILGDIIEPIGVEWDAVTGEGVGLRLMLLDTHVLVWLRTGNRQMGGEALGAADRAWSVGEAAVSAITFWELGMLVCCQRGDGTGFSAPQSFRPRSGVATRPGRNAYLSMSSTDSAMACPSSGGTALPICFAI